MTRERIFDVIKSNIEKFVDGVDINLLKEEDSMLELGADSLEIVEVVSRSMRELKIKVQRTQLSQAKNIKELIDLFETAARS